MGELQLFIENMKIINDLLLHKQHTYIIVMII